MIPSIKPEHPSSAESSSDEDSGSEYREFDDKEQEDDDEASTSTGKKAEPKRSGHPCPLCDKLFSFPNKLREHLKTHKIGRYPCRECATPTKFDTIFELRSHHKQCHSQAFHKCSQCPYTNSKPAFIRRHFQLNHVDGIPCTMPGCFIKVAKNKIRSHLRQMHSTAERMKPVSQPLRAKLCFQKCPNCEYVPDHSLLDARDQYDDLMRHIEVVHDKKCRKLCSFGCGAILRAEEDKVHWETCPKIVTEEPSESTPRLVDDGWGDTNTSTSKSVLTESSCGYPGDCGSDTEQATVELLSSSLIDAELEDEAGINEPPKKKNKPEEDRMRIEFSCEVCGRSFAKRENVRKHANACHSGQKSSRTIIKKFTCERNSLEGGSDICGKSFRTEQALQDHHNVHDGVKPYTCLTCDQKFNARDRFAVHLSKYHLTSIKDLNANISQFGDGGSHSKERSPGST